MNLLVDVQNRCWYHLDRSLDDLLQDQVDEDMSRFLKENGILLEVPEFLKDRLPKLDTQYHSPQKKEAIIIDFNEKSTHSITSVLSLMDGFNPVHLQVRYFCTPEPASLIAGLDFLDETTIEATELLIPFDRGIHALLTANGYMDKTSKVFRVIFHSIEEPFDKSPFEHRKFYFTTEKITDDRKCGIISAHNFSNNPKHAFKSMNFNSCLYKKIGIDVNGNIKNCPSLERTAGNIHNTDFARLKDIQFDTELIRKDDIEVCRDCKFRYVCSDCRAFTDSTRRPNARPLRCGYNPYIAKWSHEKDYRSLSECGVISNEDEFRIDRDRIEEVNRELLLKQI